METELESLASKQCAIIVDETRNRNPAGSFQEKFEYFTAQRNDGQEPIDLSNNNRNVGASKAEQIFPDKTQGDYEVQPHHAVMCHKNGFDIPRDDCFPKRKRKKRKFVYTQEGKLLLVSDDANQSATTFTPAKQQEILNAAKALFSKRTRTLYHWMYPNAAKQQIKTVIANSWDSLEDREKEFYISQVLGRFGYPQTNLMINPQLGTIRHLPPLPQSERQLHLRDDSGRARARRLAVLPLEGYEAGRKRGRPNGGPMRKRASAQDFQDDPELSVELEKFAMTFNFNGVV